MAKRKRGVRPLTKKNKRQFELLGVVATTAASALVVSIFLLTSLDKILVSSSQFASVVAAVLVDLTNGDRAQESIGSLTIDPKLVAAAQAKADDMAQKGYFAHVAPDGKDSWYWFKEAGYSFTYAGENLAVDFSDSADVERAWMNSPTHRRNLLDPHFTQIGIATASGYFQGHPTVFVVQMFGTPAKEVAPEEKIEVTSPSDPEKMATAKLETGTKVLGTSETNETAAPAAEPVKPPVITEEAREGSAPPGYSQPQITVEKIVPPDYAPWWQHMLASPKQTLRYAYYCLGLLVLLALFFVTGFEFHERHYRAFAAVGTVFVVMCILFLAADNFVLGSPSLNKDATMTAAVGDAQ